MTDGLESIRTRPPVPPSNRTLGYEVIEWAMRNLVHAVTGEPWVPLPEHEDFILTWFAVDDAGDWVYSQGYLRRARGTAKSPAAAVLSAVSLCGPCRFGGWDAGGFPIAVPEPAPWVQILSTTMDQTRAIFDIVANSFSQEAIREYGLEIGREMIVKTGPQRGRLEVIPNNARSLRGARPTDVYTDETSEMVAGNGGHATMVRVDGNIDKNPFGRARRLDLSNAFVPGEDSVAERVTTMWSDQMANWGFSHILLDSLEANPKLSLTDPDQLRQAIAQAAGDATWLPVERLVRSALKTTKNAVSIFRREHLNQITSEEDSLVSAQTFDAQSSDLPPLEPGERVVLGFDGSLSGDGTALVALRLSDRSFHLLHYQEPDPLVDDWRVDEEAVDDAYRVANEKYEVWGAGCDLYPFESWIFAWNRDFGDKMKVQASSAGAIIRDNRSARKDLTLGTESLVSEIEGGKIWFARNYRMKSHWLNAKRAENRYGITFRKVTKNSVHRVDIVAACLMAYLIEAKVLSANIQPPKPRRAQAHTW